MRPTMPPPDGDFGSLETGPSMFSKIITMVMVGAVGIISSYFFLPLNQYDSHMIHYYVYHTYEFCMTPALELVAKLMMKLFTVNVLFYFLSNKLKDYNNIVQLLSIGLGVYLMYSLLQRVVVLYTLTFFLMYGISCIFQLFLKYSLMDSTKAALCAKGGIISILLYLEFCMVKRDLWTQARGVVMVQAMKFISLTSFFGRDEYPTLLESLGYIFFPGTLIFGPWISFFSYQFARFQPSPTMKAWIKQLVVCALLATINLIISNCITHPLINLECNKWYTAYLKALSFRASHYFVCYLSQLCILASGIRDNSVEASGQVEYEITHPLEIELPTSLKSVVINWNIPTHIFLKYNVYRAWVDAGKFPAIVITFLVSALLHGFNLPVAMILLSLGFASFAEYRLRAALSSRLNACVGADDCKECQHHYRRYSIPARVINFVFTLFAIVNLLYLGAIMDFGTKEKAFYYVKYWKSLHFIGHFITVGMFVVTLFIRPR